MAEIGGRGYHGQIAKVARIDAMGRPRMTSAIVSKLDADVVLSFEIHPGTLLQFLESRTEKGPRLKCFEGSVTLVSPGLAHESKGSRLDRTIFAICLELRIRIASLRSTTWSLPVGSGDTAYEADLAYHIQSQGTEREQQPPDLAVEIVVSHSEKKALRAGAALKIPELWVWDIPKHRLTFHHLVTRGTLKGTYRPQPRSRAFPVLVAAELLERLDDPETDEVAYHENCREWARQVLAPRIQVAE